MDWDGRPSIPPERLLRALLLQQPVLFLESVSRRDHESRLMHRSKQRPYSITSSARTSTVAGTSRPSALAVLRLMTSSYLVGACTGRSAGFSPLRMRST
jgi:hypothetical protein